MDRLGGVPTYDELIGDEVHRLENVMVLWVHVHDLFDNLELWLERDNTDLQQVLRFCPI